MTAVPARAALVIAWLVAGCAQQAAAPGPSAGLPEGLQGLWCSPTPDGRGCWAWDHFSADGGLHLCGRHEDDTLPFEAHARYTLEGRRLCYRVERASANFWIAPGQTYCTEIVRLSAVAHTWRDIDSGQTYELLRRPIAEKACPR